MDNKLLYNEHIFSPSESELISKGNDNCNDPCSLVHVSFCVCFQVFTNFFDTTIGPKTDSDSYKKIVAEIKSPAEEILFLTDLPEGMCCIFEWHESKELILVCNHDTNLDFVFSCMFNTYNAIIQNLAQN